MTAVEYDDLAINNHKIIILAFYCSDPVPGTLPFLLLLY